MEEREMVVHLRFVDMPTIEREKTDPVAPITRDGGRERLAVSTPVAAQELGGPLVDDTLPEDTPDDKCAKMTFRNEDGKVADVKCKRQQEVICDPYHRLVGKRMEEHGRPGEEGYVPWCRDGDCVKRHADADFPVYLGGWDQDPSYAEYHGYGA